MGDPRPRTLLLGVRLAAGGPLAAAGLAFTALGALASIGAALALREREGRDINQLLTFASWAIVWGGGMTLAVGASLQSLRRDREDGILGLARSRGATVASYVHGRVWGLTALLALATCGATLAAGLAVMSLSHPALPAARTTAAALVFALAFAATLGPVSLATLGPRSRAGGYGALLAVLVLPELLAPWTAALMPHGWHELTSIPAALDAVRAGILRPSTEGAHLARALAGLAAVASLSLVAIGAQVSQAERETRS